MRLMSLPVLLVGISLQVAQASPAPEGTKNPPLASPHRVGAAGTTAGPAGMTATIQGATLPGYRKMKVGEAFGKYSHFKQKEWRETRGSAGTVYVDFVGWAPPRWFDFKSKRGGIAASGLEVKFAIYPSGEYGVVMVSRTVTRTDGTVNRYPMADVKGVLDAIYNNESL